MKEKFGYKKGLAITYYNLASLYSKIFSEEKMLFYYTKVAQMSKSINEKGILARSYNAIYQIHTKQKNFEKALDFYKLFSALQSYISLKEKHELLYEDKQKYVKSGMDFSTELSTSNKENQFNNLEIEKLRTEIQNERLLSIYESQKNEKEMDLLKAENDLKQNELNKKNIILVASTTGIIALIILSFVIFKSYRTKQKDNKILTKQKNEIIIINDELKQLNEEIHTQKNEMADQRDILMKQKKDLTDSILYASRIQDAILPTTNVLDEILPDHFILYKPRDIVSGDFYWFKQIDNYIYIAVADCTGHGVPGAFMSMLGISLLNEIVHTREIFPPNLILCELRNRIKKSLHQTGQIDETQDGMDIAFCMVDVEKKQLQFAGAFNALYIVRNSINNIKRAKVKAENHKAIPETHFLILEPDHMPIGIHPKDEVDFTNFEIPLSDGDTFYIFSDGYVSQFGGENGEKFKSRRFQDLLLKIQHESMRKQHEILEHTLVKWQANNEQVDDILVVGVRFSDTKTMNVSTTE